MEGCVLSSSDSLPETSLLSCSASPLNSMATVFLLDVSKTTLTQLSSGREEKEEREFGVSALFSSLFIQLLFLIQETRFSSSGSQFNCMEESKMVVQVTAFQWNEHQFCCLCQIHSVIQLNVCHSVWSAVELPTTEVALHSLSVTIIIVNTSCSLKWSLTDYSLPSLSLIPLNNLNDLEENKSCTSIDFQSNGKKERKVFVHLERERELLLQSKEVISLWTMFMMCLWMFDCLLLPLFIFRFRNNFLSGKMCLHERVFLENEKTRNYPWQHIEFFNFSEKDEAQRKVVVSSVTFLSFTWKTSHFKDREKRIRKKILSLFKLNL